MGPSILIPEFLCGYQWEVAGEPWRALVYNALTKRQERNRSDSGVGANRAAQTQRFSIWTIEKKRFTVAT